MTYEEEAMEEAVREGIAQRVPRKYDVCPGCEGTGTSSGYLGAFTADDMERLGDEFREDYMNGHYDRQCETCRGLRVIKVLDRKVASEELIKFIDSYVQAAYDVDAVHAQEMRFHA